MDSSDSSSSSDNNNGYPSWFNEDPVELDDSLLNTIIIDNVPITKMNRYEKLVIVIKKIFSAYGEIVDLYIPVEGEGEERQTCGYAFIEYLTVDNAQRAVIEGNNKKLDNSHTLLVNHYGDMEKYNKVKNEWVPPSREQYDSTIHQLNSWLFDQYSRDQFVIRYQKETNIYWNDPFRKSSEQGRVYVYGGEEEKKAGKIWTESMVEWSPKGSYLATYHEPGIALWGGESFGKLARLAHNKVKSISFSPNEKYLLTNNNLEKDKITDPEAMIIWDIRNKKKLRGFEKEKKEENHQEGNENNKNNQMNNNDNKESKLTMKWSHDDKYIAKISKDAISVYELPLMGLLDKKSIKLTNVQDFQWSPTNNTIAYYIPATPNSPATVGLIEIPSRKIIREKHLYNVINIDLNWQNNGDYLCMRVQRKKTKTKTTNSFEIMRIREKDIPIDVIEIEENIEWFEWENSINNPIPAHRFAILSGEGIKFNCSIYSLKGKKINKIGQYDNRSGNRLYWSPSGNNIVLAGIGAGFSGQLEFIDIENNEILANNEHFQANHIQWSPDGRYLITASTQSLGEKNWRQSMDNGYRVWSIQGQLLATVPIESLYQVLWRPRTVNVLPKDQIIVCFIYHLFPSAILSLSIIVSLILFPFTNIPSLLLLLFVCV